MLQNGFSCGLSKASRGAVVDLAALLSDGIRVLGGIEGLFFAFCVFARCGDSLVWRSCCGDEVNTNAETNSQEGKRSTRATTGKDVGFALRLASEHSPCKASCTREPRAGPWWQECCSEARNDTPDAVAAPKR